ncbi:hypothetical protein DYB28_003503, partial [Aphanomyces astaci]
MDVPSWPCVPVPKVQIPPNLSFLRSSATSASRLDAASNELHERNGGYESKMDVTVVALFLQRLGQALHLVGV